MILMLLCSMTAFAANVNSSYSGTLKIDVDGTVTTIENQKITVAENSDGTVTMTINNFSSPD